MDTAKHSDAKRKPVIGLMGAPGSGKSFIAQLFAEQGAAVIDADALAREAMAEPQVRKQLVAWWGRDILDAEGHVDRRAVGAKVFEDDEALRRLETLVHPRVHARRNELRAKHEADPAVQAIVEDCPLLLETGLDRACDVLVYVEAPYAVRAARVRQQRGWSAAELERREKNQAPLDTKRARADDVIDNGAGRASAREQVRRVLSRVLQQANTD